MCSVSLDPSTSYNVLVACCPPHAFYSSWSCVCPCILGCGPLGSSFIQRSQAATFQATTLSSSSTVPTNRQPRTLAGAVCELLHLTGHIYLFFLILFWILGQLFPPAPSLCVKLSSSQHTTQTVSNSWQWYFPNASANSNSSFGKSDLNSESDGPKVWLLSLENGYNLVQPTTGRAPCLHTQHLCWHFRWM